MGEPRAKPIDSARLPAVTGPVVVSVPSEVERLRAENARLAARVVELESLATTDALTQLANRRSADQRLASAFSVCERHGGDLACLMIDLDGLKRVNDTLGHARGDDLIRTAGETIRRTIRLSDFAARLGGDEFLVVLPMTSAAQAGVLAARLAARFERATHEIARELDQAERLKVHVPRSDGECASGHVRDDRHHALVGMSIGVASLRQSGCGSAEELRDRADRTMYRAKRDGRGCVRTAESPDRNLAA